MPEGDTLFRTAAGLRPHLVGRAVTAARTGGPGAVPRIERIVGATITEVEALGKNLLIRFDNGLELRTHLRMRGAWHRYPPDARWRLPASRARLVLEVPGSVAVCFDAPVVELFETRAEGLHGALGRLGPDLLAAEFDATEALRRLRSPERAELEIGVAILDQRALAGIGNVYKSEVLFVEGVDPFALVGDLDDAALARIVARARELLLANVAPGAGPERVTTGVARRGDGRPAGPTSWVYRRAGRPCRRCGTPIRSAPQGRDLPRTTYWCPSCQSGLESPGG
jgi:endonuclease-8